MPDQPAFNDCILAFDLDRKLFLFISPAIEHLLGYKPADIYQNPALLSDITTADKDHITQNIAESRATELHYPVLTANGETKNIHEKRELLKDDCSGNSILLSVLKTVGTEESAVTDNHVKTEKALTDQNTRLRAIASLISHDLRRPVASMLGLIAVMDRKNFSNPDNQEIIDHLLTVGNEIDEVIRQIVDKTFLG